MGFNPRELAQLFYISEKREGRFADSYFFVTFDRVLEAVIRAVRQVPHEKVGWKTPDRERTLKVFCYHILADPNHVLEAISTQKYDGSFKLTYPESAERFRTMEEVARFGEETRERVVEASKRLTAEELARPIDGYAGRTSGHELLHQVLSHTAHHLRQLYAMLRMIDVEPTAPLPVDGFRGIPMPKELW